MMSKAMGNRMVLLLATITATLVACSGALPGLLGGEDADVLTDHLKRFPDEDELRGSYGDDRLDYNGLESDTGRRLGKRTKVWNWARSSSCVAICRRRAVA